MEGGSVSVLLTYCSDTHQNYRLEVTGDRGYDTARRRPGFPSHRRTEKQGVGIHPRRSIP
jgi:hypothetical protein